MRARWRSKARDETHLAAPSARCSLLLTTHYPQSQNSNTILDLPSTMSSSHPTQPGTSSADTGQQPASSALLRIDLAGHKKTINRDIKEYAKEVRSDWKHGYEEQVSCACRPRSRSLAFIHPDRPHPSLPHVIDDNAERDQG